MEKKSFKVSWIFGFLDFWILGFCSHAVVVNTWCVSLAAAPHAGDDCPDASPDEDEAW